MGFHQNLAFEGEMGGQEDLIWSYCRQQPRVAGGSRHGRI